MFGIERAEGQLGASEGSASVVTPTREAPREVATVESEPVPPEEAEIPASFQSVVPEASSYLPPIDGLKVLSVQQFAADGSTLTTSLVPGRGICAKGTSTVLYDEAGIPDYSRAWGVAIRVDTTRWRPGDFGIQGFSFRLVGDVPAWRFQVFSGERIYCEAFTEGVGSLLFRDLQEFCYDNMLDNEYFSEPELVAFEWQIHSSTEGPKSFDFCIESITPTLGDGPPEPDSRLEPEAAPDAASNAEEALGAEDAADAGTPQ